MAGQDDDVAFSTEQAIRLARIRARVREGVWALRDNSALHGHSEALEREMRADDGALETDKTDQPSNRNNISITRTLK